MGSGAGGFCMIGNSVRSDIAPVLEIGGAGVHVPYHVTWAVEHAELDASHPRLARVTEIREAPEAIDALEGAR
jgi:putative hydrolase of the HAD superfamily